ncbi:hypothetical protein PanWU01x14_318950 [Parasponia andersonii]|uniref:Uncharacterized protein n=1 Tax=Parasponia andersonii TaxID=3476 RepID=A0A2P5AM48_PARAD|nr:hypothetical protein PanWU01x14_318950 [Parasponia andersonii]
MEEIWEFFRRLGLDTRPDLPVFRVRIDQMIALCKLYRRVCKSINHSEWPKIFRDGIQELLKEAQPSGSPSSSIGSEKEFDLNI